MFDPEKVYRWIGPVPNEERTDRAEHDRLCVFASDYDQLLADYKEAISQIRVLIKERDALVPKSSETDPAPQASA